MGSLNGEHLIIRADASTQIGIGHFMRCLALAQAWKDAGGQPILVTSCKSYGLLQRYREEGIEVHILDAPYPDPDDWNQTKDILASHPNAWVVLDGYHFDETYQRTVKDVGHPLLVIDDMAHLEHYYADIVLNQNLHAQHLEYSCEPYTHLLLGTRYVLLRREFLAWGSRKRGIPDVARRVLVTLGGSDPENYTLEVIQALQDMAIPSLEAKIVVGASNPNADVLETVVTQSDNTMCLIRDAKNMNELMAWADIAVSGGGTTCWEALCTGVPLLVLVLASNQESNAGALQERGAAIRLDLRDAQDDSEVIRLVRELSDSKRVRMAMSRSQQALVDGLGASRVVVAMLDSLTSLKDV